MLPALVEKPVKTSRLKFEKATTFYEGDKTPLIFMISGTCNMSMVLFCGNGVIAVYYFFLLKIKIGC